ncbi:hypothetical protein RRG08_038158 [Elysia crispata]|uniref:PHD-type domain-containing protein n=1 Tax=Elysia crispata TaxID=231223 RepID=A0AAE0YSA1_9GAST|nr:hypothetical protein RRG08_038158 [Elysia crispata]
MTDGTGSSIEHNSSTTEPPHLSVATTLPDQTGCGFHPGTGSSIEHKSPITEHLHLSVATTCELSDRSAAEPLLGSLALQEVTFTRVVKPRGRPRNKQLFTSRKRKKEGPKKFENLSLEKRQGLLLRAVRRPHVSLGTGLISSTELRDFSDFDDIILDSTLSLDVIQSYFSDNAWSTLSEGVASRRHAGIYKCEKCKELDDLTQKMIMCEQCLRWYHFSCAGYC